MMQFQNWLIAFIFSMAAVAAQENQETQESAAAGGSSINLTIDTQWAQAADRYQVSLMALGPRIVDHKETRVDVKTAGVDTVSATVPALKAPFKGFQISITKKGNAYRNFCNGTALKLGKMDQQPTEVHITLTEPKGQFLTKDGRVRNDAYPECQAEVK